MKYIENLIMYTHTHIVWMAVLLRKVDREVRSIFFKEISWIKSVRG